MRKVSEITLDYSRNLKETSDTNLTHSTKTLTNCMKDDCNLSYCK